MSATDPRAAARDATLVYVATAPCGCVHGIDCANDRETAKQVARWIRLGSVVDRKPLGEARALLVMDCPHTPTFGLTS